MIVFILFGLRVHDIDCGFKLFKKEVVDTIPKLESERGAFVNSEFLLHAKHSDSKLLKSLSHTISGLPANPPAAISMSF
jgi:hypothetical protein